MLHLILAYDVTANHTDVLNELKQMGYIDTYTTIQSAKSYQTPASTVLKFNTNLTPQQSIQELRNAVSKANAKNIVQTAITKAIAGNITNVAGI